MMIIIMVTTTMHERLPSVGGGVDGCTAIGDFRFIESLVGWGQYSFPAQPIKLISNLPHFIVR
jgi:hypothetical protein